MPLDAQLVELCQLLIIQLSIYQSFLHSLAEFMKGKKKSIEMTKDFASFKNYLMNE